MQRITLDINAYNDVKLAPCDGYAIYPVCGDRYCIDRISQTEYRLIDLVTGREIVTSSIKMAMMHLQVWLDAEEEFAAHYVNIDSEQEGTRECTLFRRAGARWERVLVFRASSATRYESLRWIGLAQLYEHTDPEKSIIYSALAA